MSLMKFIDLYIEPTVIFYYLFIYLFLVFWDSVSLCSPGCPGTHSVDQAGLDVRHHTQHKSLLKG